MFGLRNVNKPNRRFAECPRISHFLFLLIGLVSPVVLADVDDNQVGNAIVMVNVGSDRGHQSEPGYILSTDTQSGYVLTRAALIRGQNNITVEKTSNGAELVASVAAIDASRDLALLSVNGLDEPGFSLAGAVPDAGDVVWSAVKWAGEGNALSLSKGAVQSSNSQPGVLTHNAIVGGDPAGSIVLNDCGNIVGLNIANTGTGQVQAISATMLEVFAGNHGVTLKRAGTECISEIAQARAQASEASAEAHKATREAVRAQQVAQQLEARLQASNKKNDALIAEAKLAREHADEAMRKAEIAHQNAENTRIELEKKTASITAQTQAMMKFMENDKTASEHRFEQALRDQQSRARMREELLAGVAAIIILGLLIFNFMGRTRNGTKAAEQAGAARQSQSSGSTELHKQELAEYVLDGRDEDGIRYLLRISGDQLTRPDGVVIGRNPQDSPYIINHADVSRKHARMKVMKNRVFIEDLGSTNGTSVNGQSIDDKGLVSVGNGDQIIIGSVVMKLRVLGA
ncbi:MAG TPA: FHA domain-containing protein [Pseudomonadales bacterium]|nr:FHA domain-containing protein [Pseudomonadales bacterium]